MTGIYFEGTDSGVSLAALDGHVVAVDSVKAEGAKDMKLIVPKATAKKLISMGVIDDVTLTYTKNSAVCLPCIEKWLEESGQVEENEY